MLVAFHRVWLLACAASLVAWAGCSPAALPQDPPAPSPESPPPGAPATQSAPVPLPPEPADLPRPPASVVPHAASEVGPPSQGVIPQDFAPPFERSAKTGDGRWQPLAIRTDLNPQPEPPLLHTTTLHPHKQSPFVSMQIVALDISRLKLAWAVGKDDEGVDRFANTTPVGLVPEPDQQKAIALFNGGFLARHGRWGIQSHGVELQPQKPEGCSIVLSEDGSIHLGTWSQLESSFGHNASVRTIRQTPPCLVRQGELHPNLLAGQARRWAGANPQRKTRRRSALGINREGTLLYYAVGMETEAVDLARGMAAAGAQTALQLDINWYWVRFLLVGPTERGIRVTSALAEGMEHGKNEYFGWPSKRDFFYVTTR